MPPSPRPALDALLRRRWSIAVVAELYRSRGAKFVTLARRLGVSRTSLTATLRHLVHLGLVRRNAGYGHPLRPEYLVTEAGREIGGDALLLLERVRAAGAEKMAFKKWSLPLLRAIGAGHTRFGALREALGDVTPRALVLALKALEQAGWVRREIEAGYPPTPNYRLSDSGVAVNALLGALADDQSAAPVSAA